MTGSCHKPRIVDLPPTHPGHRGTFLAELALGRSAVHMKSESLLYRPESSPKRLSNYGIVHHHGTLSLSMSWKTPRSPSIGGLGFLEAGGELYRKQIHLATVPVQDGRVSTRQELITGSKGSTTRRQDQPFPDGFFLRITGNIHREITSPHKC